MPMAGLSPEQGPPLAVPLSFFFLAPVAMVGASALLLIHGDTVIWNRWVPATLAFTHVGTLGFLCPVMFGALYQIIPVVAGGTVPRLRLAHVVHLCLVLGVVSLVLAFLGGSKVAFLVAGGSLTAALVLFLIPVAIALIRAPTRSHTVTGVRVAVIGLALVSGFGLRAVCSRFTADLNLDWLAWTVAHASFGLVVWVGGLITAVSWQVLPMFYLADPLPRVSRILSLWLTFSAATIPAVLLLIGADAQTVSLAVGPGAAAIWLLHPVVAAIRLRRRRRRRADISLRFWYTGLGCAPVVFAAALAALWLDDPRWPLVFGWLAIWGWAGMIVHGMLTRIVPFLVWFHRFAALVGLEPVPPMRRMLPVGRATVAYWLHALTLVLGCGAIISGWVPLVYAAALTMALTGLALGACLLGVLAARAGQGWTGRQQTIPLAVARADSYT